MHATLKNAFTDEQLALAGAIGESSESLSEKVRQLFDELGDPLLSSSDVAELLGSCVEADALVEIGRLVEADVLEQSSDTCRPLDSEGVNLFRRSGVPVSRLRIVAIEADLGGGEKRIQFTCDGRVLRSVARIDRLDAIAGTGNQRTEIHKHVQQIAKGIESGNQVPNSVLLVFLEGQFAEEEEAGSLPDSFVVVRPITEWTEVPYPGRPERSVQRFRTVELDVPFRNAAFDDEKTALLVDGQQRTAALALVDIDKVPQFSLSVNAVVAGQEEAKKVFSIANSTQKIQTQFSRALLASMADAPGYLRQERAKAIACKILALEDEASPFFGLVQYPGVKTSKRPPIAYNSIFQVVVAFAESALPIDEDPVVLARTVGAAFGLVKKTWPTAWGKKPNESRLMHGVGLRAMAGFLSAKVESLWASEQDDDQKWKAVGQSLLRLQPRLVWSDEDAGKASSTTKKVWREEISNRQNTNQDISHLTSYLKKESLSLDTKAAKRKEQ
ncbi:MAG: DGQHR domain-containing protein [Nannocystaceae bacterium]